MLRRLNRFTSLMGCCLVLAHALACGGMPPKVKRNIVHPSEQREQNDLSGKPLGQQIFDQKTSFVFIGDNGQGDENQKINAPAMQHFCNANACQFISYMGDNFPAGVKTIDDPQFKSRFEDVYRSFAMPFNIVLGNHDYMGNIQAEIDYSNRSKLWHLPSRYYSYHTDQAEFFVIDTNNFDDEQGDWLKNGLDKSRYHWKIVIGHHPLFSSGQHGDNPSLAKNLLPILRNGKAKFYFSGHDHDKELIKSHDMYFVVCGTGSNPREMLHIDKTRTIFASSNLGFCHMRISEHEATLNVIDSRENVEFTQQFENND